MLRCIHLQWVNKEELIGNYQGEQARYWISREVNKETVYLECDYLGNPLPNGCKAKAILVPTMDRYQIYIEPF